MFKNKHIIIALLVTPVLAILAWFAVGALVGEKPQEAMPGQNYPLVERSNCRYDSGQCDLRNEDLRLSITFEESVQGPVLMLDSSHPLDGVLLAVADPSAETRPAAMRTQGEGGKRWLLTIEKVPGPEQRLQVVVQSGGSNWFADTSTAFLERYREQAASE